MTEIIEPKEVLFVCRQNVGRSQMAEAFYNSRYPDRADSAGFDVDIPNQKIGDWIDRRRGYTADFVIEAMREAGLDIAQSRRSPFDKKRALSYGKLVVLSEVNVMPLYLLGEENAMLKSARDPKGANMAETRTIRDEIKNLVDNLVVEIHPELVLA